MIDTKTKNKIINVLRRLTFSSPARSAAEKDCKVGPALYRCSSCQVLVYKGKSIENYNNLCAEFEEEILMEPFSMDHIDPVIDPKKGWQGFDVFIERLGLPLSEKHRWQGLCTSRCHKAKTSQENQIRKTNRRKKKC